MTDGSGARNWPATTLLGGVAEPARAQLLDLGVQIGYRPARVLMREGERTSFVLLLLDGIVKATGRAGDGREALLAVRMGGDLVGELAALDDSPRSATVTTCGPVVARRVNQAEFQAAMRDRPAVARAVNVAVVRKLRAATAHRIDLTGCDVTTRLARVLNQIAGTYGEPRGRGVEIRWPITQPELATLAAAAEPSVHRALRGLRESGVVSTGYRSIRIEDLALLRRIAVAG
ncbi:Crp/Fnr family transcriptional regulator [Streptomyces profundus]|uniref:Crp/Fnr family transcriptional regulator n=1 Tax=Streptomyces profundus TaxID=2867410 RepID=UPI001D164735|nr:Crp/Fnr family transcriptional regulator [Streptomyces sp. MA3_2.13]UED84886.1 Crp/Fnr family transcriptional regulator [Streptomyces sp. MA3_2.13]